MAPGRSPLALLCAFAALLGLPATAAAQDTTPPVNTTPAAPAGWLDAPYVVLLSGTDETLLDRMEWTVDGGATINAPDGDGNAEITAGARSGMYISTGDNARRGEAFVLANRGGVEHHIYGSGKDREVIPVRRSEDER